MDMWEHVSALAYQSMVERGLVYAPEHCADEAGEALLWAMRAVPPEIERPLLAIDTMDGDEIVWAVAREMEERTWDCYVIYKALSAGLILTCACTGRRVCHPGAKFIFHGGQARNYAEQDQVRAEWFAERTLPSVEFWLDHCEGEYVFRAEEALDLGVVHEIGDMERGAD